MLAHTIKRITLTVCERFRKLGVTTIVYLEIDHEVDKEKIKAEFELVYAFENLPVINNITFDHARNELLKLSERVPGMLNYKGYNVVEGAAKDVFWGTYEAGAINYQAAELKKRGYRILDGYSRPMLRKKVALFKKLFIGKNVVYKLKLDQSKQITDSTVFFRINEPEMIEMYGNLIPELHGNDIISFQNILRDYEVEMDKNLKQQFKTNIRCANHFQPKNIFSFSDRLKFFFSSIDADRLNVMADVIFKLANHIDNYELLASNGARRFFLAAAENEGEGNVACMVAARHGGVTYNYMNGAKGKEHNNIHSYFNYWFMHDESTRNLLLSYCKVTEAQLPVTGHLLEDTARAYHYAGTLDKYAKELEGKNVLALFSSALHKKEQIEVCSLLERMLNNNPHLVVLVRKHMFDYNLQVVNHPRMIVTEVTEGKLYNQGLFDLMVKSCVSISYSSTVSFQSAWFNLTTINVEFAEKSLLPYVDNKRILHAHSVAKLEQLLQENWLVDRRTESSTKHKPVSQQIIQFIKLPLPQKEGVIKSKEKAQI